MGNCLHVIQRGKGYAYVCRVPRDLLHLFPKNTIWKSLKAESAKDARLLAGAEEYRTQQLFMQLRTGMLDKELEKRLIAMFLKRGLDDVELVATGQPPGMDKAVEAKAEELAAQRGLSRDEARELLAKAQDHFARDCSQLLSSTNTSAMDEHMGAVASYLKEKHGVKLPPAQKKTLALKFINAVKQVHEAQSAVYRGEWSLFETLREKAERDLATPYFDLKTALEKYQENYLASKPDVKPGTKEDMQVECRVLLEIFGNISVTEFNTMDSVTELKRVLLRYPKNKQQRFGDRSIHSIIRSEAGYEKIGRKTANEYIKRAKSVVDYANKAKMLSAANVYEGELFKTDVAAENERSPYDSDDITRLIDALCTQPLWSHKPPKPERFWIILIALFHGFRLDNIVKLTKQDIVQTDKGTWVFRLRTGKTKSTVRPVAICDTLQLLGFLKWVESLKREKLFQDSSASFSQWYNRYEQRGAKWFEGFEPRHVTKDPKKCLYSLRHSFAGNVFDVTDDYKITADMMGHSTGHSVTSRYTKATKAETLKEVTEKMRMENIDLDRLEARAKELFGL